MLDFEHISRVTQLLTQKWNIEIILTLHSEGTLRFNELKKLCISEFRGAINTRVLVERLKYFQYRGLVDRLPYNEFPPRVEYRLTQDGEQFARMLCKTLQAFIDIMPCKQSELLDDDEQRNYMQSRKKLLSKKIEKNMHLYNHIIKIIEILKQ